MKPSGRQIWFITGCDKGLGHAIAEAALQRGETVVATVLAADGRSPLSAQYANNFRCHHLDVTDHVTARELIAATEKEFGCIDVLVNNAGFGLVGAAEETEPAEYRRMFEVNFFGMVELTRAVLPGMRARRSGHIINLSSLVGFVGASGFAFYSASKFALEGFSESLAKEVEPLGIKVTIVEPGGFRTDFAGESLARAKKIIDDYNPTSGNMRTYLTARDGQQPGNPALLGAALCTVVSLPDPPLRLSLGADAWEQISKKAEFVTQESERWKALSMSTAFDA
jgi:NAD(P)-dependent dehydrogenase (short-subunit alcohol dehydrogenase family)